MKTLTSRAMLLPIDNIDTDRIIPARFLITTKITGLGRHFFNDWLDGRGELSDTRILVTGDNFGCGSSREHAVWALADAGIEAVISTKFADIFHANALRNRLIPVVLRPADHRRLVTILEHDPVAPVSLDYEAGILTCDGFQAGFTATIDSLGGDETGPPGAAELEILLGRRRLIDDYESARPGRVNTIGTGR